MKLEDILDSKYGLQQDDYSLSGEFFGSDHQLCTIGWSGKNGNNNKYYILECSLCKQDSELFGDGVFRTTRAHLREGKIPCGCSPLKYSKEQYFTLCDRKARVRGFELLGFCDKWLAIHTKLRMACDKHGEWNSTTINNLIVHGAGCPLCSVEERAARNTKPEEVMSQTFLNSGGFHVHTKFWRSPRTDNRGRSVYWYVSCPECGEVSESTSSNLRKGVRSCLCSTFRQKEAYINIIKDYKIEIGVKFGIANISANRLKRQSRTCIYELQQYGVWVFPDKRSCLQAELECKQSLVCGIIGKQEMPDGRTETTYLYNLERVIEIYEKHGGLKREEDISSGH